jgi:hypothetical protein
MNYRFQRFNMWKNFIKFFSLQKLCISNSTKLHASAKCFRRISKQHMCNGHALQLLSVGQGYPWGLTFGADTSTLSSSNYFWSDSSPDGFAFELEVVSPGDKFMLQDASSVTAFSQNCELFCPFHYFVLSIKWELEGWVWMEGCWDKKNLMSAEHCS